MRAWAQGETERLPLTGINGSLFSAAELGVASR